MNTKREIYREESGWPAWINVILVAALASTFLAPVLERGLDSLREPETLFVMGVVILVFVLVRVLLMGLTVVIRTDAIEVGLGKGWPIRTRIPLDQIAEMESVTYRPLRQFGGWGVRGTRARRAWTARGNRALLLTLNDGRLVYIGSETPERLEERVAGLNPSIRRTSSPR